MRIALCVPLFIVEPLSPHFFVIYVLCGLSDVLDGHIARKVSAVSKLGAMLDSIADFIFVGVMFIIFARVTKFSAWIIAWICVIACVKFASLLVGFCKYHTFSFLHTYANKVTGIVLFCFPVLFKSLGEVNTYCFICAIAFISAVEELVITIMSEKFESDIKSIFIRLNK